MIKQIRTLSFFVIGMFVIVHPAYALFTRPLTIGSSGDDVSQLQQILSDKDFFNFEITGYFGKITQNAVAAFQRANKLDPIGFVGPATRALLNEILANGADENISASSPKAQIVTFNNPLSLGMKNDEVARLQTFLKDKGYFTYPEITGFYGPATVSAVKKFQIANNIDALGNVGPLTRAKLNELISLSHSPASSQGSASSSSNSPTQSNSASSTISNIITNIQNIYNDITRSSGVGPAPVLDPAPSLPTSVAATAGDATSTISWANPTDSDLSYISIYRGTVSGSLTRIATTTATTTYSDVPIHNGTTYYYALTATDVGGHESSKTSEITATPDGVYDIYVDSVNGNDANDGTSDYLAFKTISSAQAALSSYGSGVKIGLKKGSTWRERLTVTQDLATIEAYGSGSKPVLDGADIIATSSWSKTAGKTNLYQATLPIELTSHGAAVWGGVWIDGVRLTEATSTAAADTIPGSYVFGAPTSSPVTLYVNSTGSTNPASDGKTYEYTRRSSGLDTFDAASSTIRGIKGRRNLESYGSIILGRGGSAYDIQVSEGNTHNILVRANTYVENLLADEAYASAGGEIPFVFFENSAPAGATAICSSCTVTRTTGSGTAFYSHTTTGTLNTFSLINPTINQVSGAIGISAANLTNLIVTNATVNGGATAMKSGAASTTVSTFTFNNPTTAGSAAFITDAANTRWNISGLTVNAVSGNINIGPMFQITQVNTNLTLSSSTMNAASGKGHFFAIRSTVASSTIVSTGNSFRPNSGGAIYSFTNTTGLSYTSDFNNFQVDGSFTIGTTTYSTAAAYKTATGQDSHSTP